MSYFGNYDEGLAARADHLSVFLNGANVGLVWQQCNLMATFTADYFRSFFSGEEESEKRTLSRRELTHSISFVVNELVENAIKFGASPEVRLSCGLLDDRMVLLLQNTIATPSAPAFQSLLSRISSGNPQEQLIRQIEKNVSEGNIQGSGIGFLTLMADYGVKLGWRFEEAPPPADPDRLSLWTLAQLGILKESPHAV